MRDLVIAALNRMIDRWKVEAIMNIEGCNDPKWRERILSAEAREATEDEV